MSIQLIPTTTEVDVQATNVSIRTFYESIDNEPPYTVRATIIDRVGSLNGISYIENQLLIAMNRGSNDIDYNIDNEGNLIVTTPNVGDADKYEINADGALIYRT